jgi:hypothetical protein
MSPILIACQYHFCVKSINADSKAFSSNDVQNGTADPGAAPPRPPTLNLSYTGHVDDDLPVPTSPASESVRLQAEASRNRIQFLRTELETSFTLASVAEAEQQRGEQHAVQSLADAETGYATMVRFLSDPEYSKHFTQQESMELSAGMERLRATLDRLGRRQK